MKGLERRLIGDILKGNEVDPETALLIASGVESREIVDQYRRKIGEILERFHLKLESKGAVSSFINKDYMIFSRAELLFQYLWESKPRRHGHGFSLAQAVDAQLGSDVKSPVGSCVGLTALYSVLCLREGVGISVLSNGDHVLSRLRHGALSVDVENTDPSGFDASTDNSFEEFPCMTLVPIVFNSRGIREKEAGNIQSALALLNGAIALFPGYANAYNNRGNIFFELGEYEMAREDYGKALEIRPDFTEACYNLGLVHEKLGDTLKSLYYFEKTLEISPDCEDAGYSLEHVKKKMSKVAR